MLSDISIAMYVYPLTSYKCSYWRAVGWAKAPLKDI